VGGGAVKHLILLASAFSYRVASFERAAAKLGIPVVRGEDVPPPLIGRAQAALPLDYRDLPRAARAIERYARAHPVGAVIGLDDSGTLLAAQASARLRLPCNSPQAARAAANKHLMRRAFAAAGVPSPEFHAYTLQDDPAEIAARSRYPAVIKPVSLSGSRGVMRADTPAELRARLARLVPILQANRCAEFLVEDFIPGAEVALEGLLDDGRLHVLALFDKPDPLDGPFFEETLYVTPSRLPAASQQAICGVARRAAAALGLRHGPVHAELRLSPAGPVMVELAARSIGGNCAKTLRFGTEASLEELILRQAFGLGFDSDREPAPGGVMMIPIPAAGILIGVHGEADARQVDLIEEVEIAIPLHQRVVPLPEGGSYLGFIFARGGTPAAVEAALREAHGKLYFEISPELPVFAG
jgi:biotin carboxylase